MLQAKWPLKDFMFVYLKLAFIEYNQATGSQTMPSKWKMGNQRNFFSFNIHKLVQIHLENYKVYKPNACDW